MKGGEGGEGGEGSEGRGVTLLQMQIRFYCLIKSPKAAAALCYTKRYIR